MNYEKSCGAVVYRKFHGNTEILLIRHIKSGYWSFPKGHVEKGETEIETAEREIKEETNIDVLIDSGFRETVTFSPRRDTSKTVVYFVGKAISNDPKFGICSDKIKKICYNVFCKFVWKNCGRRKYQCRRTLKC